MVSLSCSTWVGSGPSGQYYPCRPSLLHKVTNYNQEFYSIDPLSAVSTLEELFFSDFFSLIGNCCQRNLEKLKQNCSKYSKKTFCSE
jgi:hypothetical protein